jgi:hypothetical protein
VKNEKENLHNNHVASLMLLLVSASILTVKAAPEITLTPSTGEPYDSVEVVGTGFAPDTTVGIGFGDEVQVTGEGVTVEGAGGEPAPAGEPWFGHLANGGPIKPLSFNATSMVGGVEIPFADVLGNGTCSSDSTMFYMAHINYSAGVFSRTSTADLAGYDMTDAHVCDYIRYEQSATLDDVISTDSSGAFTADIAVPLHMNGTCTVTAIDELGNVATTEFTIFGSTAIPEGLSFGVVVILSALAVIVATLVFRKRSKIDK